MKLNQIYKPFILFSFLALVACAPKKDQFLLPVFGEKKVMNNDTVYHTVKAFSLINQYGEEVNNTTVKGRIFVADFFFATCQSICPVMTKNLTEVQKVFSTDDSVLILSHSVNPLHDTVAVLKDYAASYGAVKNKWHFLTGDKKQIYTLAKTSYLVNAIEDDGTPEGFLHSELLLLIDAKGRMRGMYDGTDKAQVTRLISDIHQLKKESKDL
jgi:protein SCO1